MILYHFSNEKHEILTPQSGINRNESEDQRIFGRPAVWFTADNTYLINGVEGKYRYTIEIDENDPYLILDEALKYASEILGDEIKWYASLIPREYNKLEKWNASTSSYE